MIKKTVLLLLYILIAVTSASGQLRLPQLVSDGMVLQRDSDITIWGWASPGDDISIEFRGDTYNQTADDNGNWSVEMNRQDAGGPFTMHISSDENETIRLENILVGDVWVASGQSNMELPMYRVRPLYEDEMQQADDPGIRYFDAPKTYDFNTSHEDFGSGSWQQITPETIVNFSATAWFFAKSIRERYDVPVGIILSALGGSPAESWMSEEALKEFPSHYNELQMFKDGTLIKEIEEADQKRSSSWYGQLQKADAGYSNPESPWYDPATDYRGWDEMNVPGYWVSEPLGPVNGVVWFQKEIDINEEHAGKPATLELGRIVDADSVFVNGTFVGTTSYQYPPRWYDVPAGVLMKGVNDIVVRVINSSGRGGFIPDKPYELIIENDTLDLKGTWNYKLGAEMPPLAGQTFVRWKPGGLFNAMISPALNYDVKGVIWYQGESNTDSPEEYSKLFPALIKDWRNSWDQQELPFLYVQLTNFMGPKDQPSESNWAELREAQRQTLEVPNTGMAVTIDIGEWNDIHPLNKKDVGERLARSAMKVAYDEDDVIHSGPVFDEADVREGKVVLSFTSKGSGLERKGEQLHGFSIAGPEGEFRWARATIEGNQVIVWHPEIDCPSKVRYAWADNPDDANLYNVEGLPASPFQVEIDR
ncbi:sialate O-acetylesterase [Rhodohalobacter sp. 8-1]|uniref:sialate O-acetylesterase n=1 Tax=Rhodohalobacter sp. 8-1 TaxID=3131972 RepID=UPI0030EB1AC4